MTKILDRALSGVEDRLERGDTVLSKDGPKRVPVRCRDLTITSRILFDKRQLLRSMPTPISSGTGLSDIAAKLVQAFQSVVQRNEKTVEGTAKRVTDDAAGS
jgi:hypothetical protein